MPVVAAAAAAQHVDLRRVLHEATILIAEFVGVAIIEIGGVVQLLVALTEAFARSPRMRCSQPVFGSIASWKWVGWAQLIM